MRQIRFAAIALVSFVAAIVSSFIDPGTFFNRTLSFTLCSVLGFTSNLCYANLARNSGDRAVAAFPPTEQTQNTFPTLDFSPYLQSTRPEFEGSEPTTKPETSNPPSNSSPPQPSPSAPINTRSPEPSRLTPAGSTSNVPCNPTLLTASAQPAKQVIVKGVPSSFTELFAGVKADGLKSFIPTLARRLDNGDVAVTVPLHPTKGKAGGDVQLVIGGSNATCPVLSLRIEPFAPAPGTANRLVASLDKYTNQIAQGLGVNPTILDVPNNPNNLKAILAGTAPILEGQRIDLKLLDSLLANSGVIESLESLSKKIPKLEASVNFSPTYKVSSVLKQSSNLGYLAPVVSNAEKGINALPYSKKIAIVDPFTPSITAYCSPGNIKTANQLSSCMDKQKEYEQLLNSPEYKAYQKTLETSASAATAIAIGAVIATLVTGGTITIASVPVAATAAAASTIFGVMGFDMFAVVDSAVGLLPSKLKGLTFDVSKPSFPPDDKAPGFVQNVKLKAVNKGWEITPEKIKSFVETFVGGVIAGGINELGKKALQFSGEVSGEFLKTAADSLGTQLSKLLSETLKGKIKPSTSEVETFEVDATPSKFPGALESTSVGIIAIEPSKDSYRPTSSPGEGTVIVRSKPNSFGGSQSVGFSQVITVGKKDNPKPQPQDGGGGSSWGDPHLVTFDGLKYDHQAVGEFILAKSTDSAFEVQARQSPVPSSSQVALNTAVAMKVGNSRVAFYAKDFPDSDTTNPLRVDGKPTVIQGGSLSLPGGGTITQVNQGSYVVQWSTGERVGVKVDQYGSSALLDINPALPQTRQGQLVGLLGDFNGDPNNDLKSRDGKVLPPQSSINQVNQITQNITKFVPIPLNQIETAFLEQLHKQFGDSWRVSQAESLFDYAPGKNTQSFTNRTFPNGFQVLRMLLPAQVQAAEAACRKAGVPSERLEGCLFDVGVTGNADFAKVAANALTNIVRDRVQQEIRDRVPVPGGIKIPGLPF
jgi:hypothetical protein